MDELAVAPKARAAILDWYDATGRDLAFRGIRDPYAILVSEVMAQQTQVARVVPKWAAFLEAFPSVRHLAAAPVADVLRAWRGLGYNRRALSLQRAARAIVEHHGCVVPGEVEALERLPGIGPYTARAVAALAFGRQAAPVDTNVRRVLQRLAGRDVPSHRLQVIADAAVPADRPADWTHALMDLGATVCRASTPACPACPARRWCRTARRGGLAPRRSTRRRKAAFASTSRWLRGRIVDVLRDAPSGEWATVIGPVGEHGERAVSTALDAMEREGLLERHREDPTLARLPQAESA